MKRQGEREKWEGGREGGGERQGREGEEGGGKGGKVRDGE